MFFEEKKILFEDDIHFSLVSPRIIRAENSAKSRFLSFSNHHSIHFLYAALAIGELEIAASIALVLEETGKTHIWETAERQSLGSTARSDKFY